MRVLMLQQVISPNKAALLLDKTKKEDNKQKVFFTNAFDKGLELGHCADTAHVLGFCA
jgi:hypothetical protein